MSKYTLFPYSIGPFEIIIIPQLENNYSFLMIYGKNALLIDPAEKNLYSLVEEKNLTLTHILSTHHHTDHVAANEYLKKKTNCQIYGPNDDRIPGITKKLLDLEKFSIGPFSFQALATPGHTTSHIVYNMEKEKVLFSGDTLFGMGCGRLFEGSAEQMLQSLQKICRLDENTLIFCGHEYTLKNLCFARNLEKGNGFLNKRLETVEALVSQKKPTIPFSLKQEKVTNPFLRVFLDSSIKIPGFESIDSLKAFKTIRKMRDDY